MDDQRTDRKGGKRWFSFSLRKLLLAMGFVWICILSYTIGYQNGAQYEQSHAYREAESKWRGDFERLRADSELVLKIYRERLEAARAKK